MKIRSFLNVFGNFNVKTSSVALLFFLFTVLPAQQDQPENQAAQPPVADNVANEQPQEQQADEPVVPEQMDDNPLQDLQENIGNGAPMSDQLKMSPRGMEKIQTVLVENFESSELWYGGMFVDDGMIQVQKIRSVPKEVRDTEAADKNKSKFVLGAKVVFLRRTFSEASIESPRPIKISGFAKKMSLYVLGRGVPHAVYAVVKDMHNRTFRIKLGDLRHSGWKKLEALIPDHLVQEDPRLATHYRRRGLLLEGFLLKFDPLKAVGNFYVYFDNFSVDTDMYLEEEDLRKQRLPLEERTEPVDNW